MMGIGSEVCVFVFKVFLQRIQFASCVHGAASELMYIMLTYISVCL